MTRAEKIALRGLRNDPAITILIAAKGNATVVMDTADYIEKMTHHLNTCPYQEENREYTLSERIIHKALLEELSKRKQAGEKNLAIRRKKIVRLDHKGIWDSPFVISGKMAM